ncbi:MAG TPA: MerR family transcriptional regulator [Acidimicrobiia bacterium]|jgi:DNA-binding transcriptional MerR regulator|nr:MerR family transcriptional regulator [Acidimicrobiia bacterium]
MGEACWRIDELAQRASLTVDTIRYYAREGLLSPPTKQGRHRLYGSEHLERLDRIRELQAQRFSLAAIRAIVDADQPGLEGLFTTGERGYSLAELIERSGVDEQLVDGLREVGLLPDPAEFGGESYDDTDLAVLRAIAELHTIGMTPEILLALGRIYVDHFAELQRDVLDMLSGRANLAWNPEELVTVQHQLTANAQRLVPAINQVLNYVHQRTLQRLTLEAARQAERPAHE